MHVLGPVPDCLRILLNEPLSAPSRGLFHHDTHLLFKGNIVYKLIQDINTLIYMTNTQPTYL
jgi:hypothetical protein